MKIKSSLIATFALACVLSLSSFTSATKVSKIAVSHKFTTVEFGDFITNNDVFFVYGDAGTHNVTSVTNSYGAVASYTYSYDGVVLAISGVDAMGHNFFYRGKLVWA